MKKKDNLIHIKFDYSEALESKKDLLSLELELVKILKIIKEYKVMRIKELRLKKQLKGKTSSSLTNVKRILGILPKIKLNSIESGLTRFTKKEKETDVHDLALESELRLIQEKLRALQE